MKTKHYNFSLHMSRIILLSCMLFFTSCNMHSQTNNTPLDGKWYFEMQHNDLGLSRIIMDIETDSGHFEAYSRKGAAKDILGKWKSFLAGAMTSNFKKGTLLRIEDGIYEQKSDTIKFAGIFTSAVGSYNIDGFVAGGALSATLSNKNSYKGSIKGSKQVPPLPLQNYNALFHKTMEKTEDKIYNKAMLETKEWKTFVKTMEDVSVNMQDDLEMLFAFYYYAGKLPMSHYMLMKPFWTDTDTDLDHGAGTAKAYKPTAFLEEKNPSTAYLKITSFGGSAAEMDSVLDIVVKKGYSNLIVDLRNNPGGSVDAGMAFATRVADDTFYGGVFLTQKYFNSHTALPTVKEYETFPHFTESNYDLLMEGIHNTNGVCLKVIPKAPVYSGRLFILTNGGTGSTCEPIVYGFKQRKRATIVGTTTAGAMLAAEMFDVSDGFKIFLPTADYYASDGFRIDKVGVQPDVNTGEGDALQHVMENLLKS